MKDHLNIHHKVRSDILQKTEKIKPRYDLKESSIKFRGGGTESTSSPLDKVAVDHQSGKFLGRAKTNIKTRNGRINQSSPLSLNHMDSITTDVNEDLSLKK